MCPQSKWSGSLLSSGLGIRSCGSRSELSSIAWLSYSRVGNRGSLNALGGIIRQSQSLRHVCLIISRMRCPWPILMRCIGRMRLEKLWDRLMAPERPRTGKTNGAHIYRPLSYKGLLPLNITRGRIYPQSSRDVVLDIV